MERTSWEAVVSWLASPMVRGVLFILIVLGAYSEFHAPGMSVPGAIALLSLVLYLGPLYLAGFTVTWEIVAVLLGLVLLALEIFVIPGFGVAGIAGFLLVAVGFVASFVPQEPGYGPVDAALAAAGRLVHLSEAWTVVAGGRVSVSIMGMALLARILPRVPVVGRLVPKNPTREQVIPEDPHAGHRPGGRSGRRREPAAARGQGAVRGDVARCGQRGRVYSPQRRASRWCSARAGASWSGEWIECSTN